MKAQNTPGEKPADLLEQVALKFFNGDTLILATYYIIIIINSACR